MSSGIIEAKNDNQVFEDLKLPSNVEELVQTYSYMSYDVVVLRNGQKSQESTVKYDYLGKEELENIEIDKVSFKIADKINEDIPSDMLFWLDGTDIKKMEVSGEVIPAQMAGMMGDRLLNAIFSPFYSLSNYDIEKLKKVGEVSHSQEEFCRENIEVTTIEVKNIPEYKIELDIAKIGKYEDVSFVLSYDYVFSEEDLEINFEVNNIELH